MDSITLLELLENEFYDEKGFIRRKVDVNRCVRIVEDLKNSLPDCIAQAKQILDRKENILQHADSVAKTTINTAQEKAKSMLSDSEVGQLAQIEAKKMLNKASIQRDVLIDKTKSHLDKIFDETEDFLQGLLNIVKTNRRELRAIVFD